MAYVLTAIASLAVGAVLAWLVLRRPRVQVTGAPTDASAAVQAAGKAAEVAAQAKAREVANAPDAALVARIDELRARGRSGK